MEWICESAWESVCKSVCESVWELGKDGQFPTQMQVTSSIRFVKYPAVADKSYIGHIN